MTTSLPLDRRTLIVGGAGLLIGQALARRSAARASSAPMTTSGFLDTIGVNTHLEYPDSLYNDVSGVIAAMQYCGLRFARDGAVTDRLPNAAHYGRLAAAGVKFCMPWGPGRSMSDEMRQLDALEAEHPGAVDALEGPNEIKPGFSYAGMTGTPAAQRFMADMRKEAAGYERLRGKPLVAFTGYSGYDCDCDFANVHVYPRGGRQPGALVRQVHDRWVGPGGFMAGKGLFLTEFGYHTVVGKPTKPGAWQGVDEGRQAILLVNGLFDAASMGVARIYVYELLDERRGRPGYANPANRFGLFRADGAPKPAATALKRLHAVLSDAATRGPESAGAPTMTGLEASAAMNCLPLRGPGERMFLCLWREDQVWNSDAAAPLAVAPVEVAVSLSRPTPALRWDLLSSGPGAALGSAARFDFELGAEPAILQIG
jgi:hypothetical protein